MPRDVQVEWAVQVVAVLVLTVFGRRAPEPQQSLIYFAAFVIGLILVASVGRAIV